MVRGTYHAATSRRHTRTKPPMIIWFVPSMNSVKREDTWSICPICAIWTMSCSEPLELPCIGKRPALPGMVCATLRSSGVPPFLLRGHLIFWMHPIRSNNRIEMHLNSLNNTLLFMTQMLYDETLSLTAVSHIPAGHKKSAVRPPGAALHQCSR